ncbi:LacI family DNA-binding transcriptional regulator [Streptomyces sp. SID13726]|uniref:LacI family DNA-binding transcriptional regulator n=1 Tax=Streptomyces sp. SID13726 TaxID=2706058 RepID=UPI0013B8EED1|nr:LacI family DNA-binding transcriptional regulator [Streptomyces sp. SID13726]NEA98788.1 LacI family transcriptional regulator [Streptomyces sp. SID13726]
MTRPAKRITSADVAKAAGVSPTTVSYVLNNRPGQSIPEDTRRRVLDAAERLQYRPHASARALAAGRSDIVLLSIPDLPIGPSISRFVEELTVSLAEHGLTLVTHLMAARGRSVPDVCATVGASAVLGFEGFDEPTVQALHRLGVSVVLPPTDAHLSAMPPVGRMQAEHLIGRGHRRIGYLLPSPARFHRMGQERLQGVVGACAHAGLAEPLALGAADLDILDLAGVVQRWTAEEVTGVCAFNDEHAIALLAAMRHLGLTAPDDLAVIGADDIPMARFAAPPLSTVYFDLEEAGKHRAQAVAAGLAGRDVALPAPRTSLRLVERASS